MELPYGKIKVKISAYKMQESLLRIFGPLRSTYMQSAKCDKHRIIEEKKSK